MGVEQIASPTAELTEELNRILEIGQLLSSVLTPEEIENLHLLFEQKESTKGDLLSIPADLELGNTSVT